MKKILFLLIITVTLFSACDKSEKSPCDGVDCSGHGVCDDASGRAVCNCDDGFVPSGVLECIEAADPCAGVECEEWESCVNGDCRPVSGRCNEDEDCTGSATCDKETHTCIGPCSGIDCGGHGECKEGGYGSGSGYESGIYCECEDGYVNFVDDGIPTCVDKDDIPDGEDTDHDNPCDGVKCSGKGNCDVVDGGPECICDKGYVAEGLECVADLCAGVVCEEWEECSEGTCELKSGRCYDSDDCTGEDKCDIATHECGEDKCVSVDCENGGVCTIENSKAVCNCPNGFKPDGTKCVADTTAPTWIGVQWPYVIDVTIGEAGEVVYGQIYMSNGTTGGSVPQNSGWKAQLGVKKDVTSSEYPVISATWRWVDATFNSSYTGNNHEYMAGFPMDKSGDFAYIYRFSLNNGESWWYCDKGVVGDTPGPNFITSANNYPGIATVKGTMCGTEICKPWERCAVDECELLEGRCNTSDDCGMGYECDGTNTCVASEVELIVQNLVRTSNSLSFEVVYSGANEIDMNESVITLNGVDVTDSISYDESTAIFTVSKTGLTPDKYSYLFRLVDAGGNEIEPLFVPVWVGDGRDFADFGWRDAFVYQLMTDRFLNGDTDNDVGNLAGITVETEQWLGGDFRGIINKIKDNYFTDMGVNALWISSPILNPHTASVGGVNPDDLRSFSSYHAYHPVASGYSYTNDFDYNPLNGYDEGPIDTAFGTVDELHELVAEAHKKGIRVIPDFVANHVHSDSNLYQDNKSWFYPYVKCDGNWDSHRIDCWFTEYMPDFNYAGNPAARKAMIDHAIWLVQEFNLDGFRADALKHMDDIFVKEMKTAVKTKIETTVTDHDSPDEAEIFYMVGESLGGWARYHTRADMVQGQVNEDFYSNAKNYLLWGNGKMSDLANWTIGNDTTFLTEQPTMGGAGGFPGAVMGNFFGNHDQDRALSECGGDYSKLKHAQTYLMTAPVNVPMLYQGDDIGMTGRAENGLDGGRRKMMKLSGLTSDEADALAYMKKLGNFRKNYEALRYGKRETCVSSDNGWIYKLTYNGQTVIVGINRGSSGYSGTCTGISGTFKNLDGNNVTVTNGSVTVPAHGSVVLGKK
ncbi:MAG: alpha-amylase family glycosyl hydrolase [bacterium]|jgi:glycosidase|nr:alpha-amylase family glycosyl hydrolase [bacterium]